jgi:hypothetical protein
VRETREGQGDEPTLEELQARVFDRGRSLARAASALRGEMREAADWRTHAARHPYLALGAAAVVGVLSASLLRRRRDPQARMIQAAAQGLERVSLEAGLPVAFGVLFFTSRSLWAVWRRVRGPF